MTASYFRLLGALLYNEPSTRITNLLIDEAIFDELPDHSNELMEKGRRQVNEWLKSAEEKTLTEDASVDYMRLFVGVGKVLAPPWGSVYLDEDGLLFNEETLVVRQFYERFGMMLKEKYKEPDDHIGLELEFLAHLAEQNNNEAMVSFAKHMMLPWVSRWNDNVQQHARTDYYRGLANMATGGIEELIR